MARLAHYDANVYRKLKQFQLDANFMSYILLVCQPILTPTMHSFYFSWLFTQYIGEHPVSCKQSKRIQFNYSSPPFLFCFCYLLAFCVLLFTRYSHDSRVARTLPASHATHKAYAISEHRKEQCEWLLEYMGRNVRFFALFRRCVSLLAPSKYLLACDQHCDGY